MNTQHIDTSARQWALSEEELERVRAYFAGSQTSAEYDALSTYEQAAVNDALLLQRQEDAEQEN
jgi:hypothetical protein